MTIGAGGFRWSGSRYLPGWTPTQADGFDPLSIGAQIGVTQARRGAYVDDLRRAVEPEFDVIAKA